LEEDNTMSDLIGKSLGRYHILEQLGEGGMAVVYKAYDTRLERNVAIKVITPSRQLSKQFLQRFEIEAKALAQLSHPNIVKVLDFGEQDGMPYIVMEWLPGGTLKSKMGKSILWHEAAQMLVPAAQALGYVHRQGIVHRDVKPANILIAASGQPMLSDFGIAKLLESEQTLDLTGTGVGVGTPEYMAPEQGAGQPVDARADIYALGIVFYEMVTGRKPYQADTPMAVVLKKMTDPLPSPARFVPGLPAAVEQTLIKALAKDPANRFQTMDEFALALEKLASKDLVALPVAFPSRLVVAGLAVGIVLCLLVAVGFILLPRLLAAPAPSPAALVWPTSMPTENVSPSPLPALVISTTSPVSSEIAPVATPVQLSTQREINSGDGAEMILIPEGTFIMGSDLAHDPLFWGAEKPIHEVFLSPYYIYRTEVTNSMYQACVTAAQCRKPDVLRSRTRKSYFENPQFNNYPVIYVTWQDAVNYCKWAGGRLPSEAEWEKAARGTDGRRFPWGDDEDGIGRAAFKHGDTEPVGTYPTGASPYGLLDVAGNVLEWVNDNYAVEYYNQSPLENPTGPDFGTRKGYRGGSWYSLIDGLRTAARASSKPDQAMDIVGFRCAMDENK